MKKIFNGIFLFILCTLICHLVYAENAIPTHQTYTKEGAADPLGIDRSMRSIEHGARPQARVTGSIHPSANLINESRRWSHIHQRSAPTALGICGTQMYALTTPKAVVDYLKSHHYESCIEDLWDFTSELKKLFIPANLTAVLNEIVRITPQYDGTNANHVYELLFFVRVAFYHNWYHPGEYDIGSIRPFMASTLAGLFNNSRIYDKTALAGNILEQLIQAVDAADLHNENNSGLEKTLTVFLDDISRISIYEQGTALYATLDSIYRSIWNSVVKKVSPNMIHLLKQYCLRILPEDEWVPINAAYALGTIARRIPESKQAALLALEAGYYKQPPWSMTWIWIIASFELAGNDCVILSTGEQVCKSKVQNELKTKLFPTVYPFENNTIVVNTALSLATVEPLYYAAKEVKAQFGRVMRKMIPVPDDPNPVLKIYLYATRKDYTDYHSFIFGISSDNGGIYIESDGTFYTYQRTSAESIYSLQELFRHEYTHYLQGRFLEPGLFGEDPFYDNDRLTYFDEGSAEFFAGSYTRDNIPRRKVIVNLIKNYETSQRMSIAQIVKATYNNAYFYEFGCMLFNFLYDKHIDYFHKVMDLIYAHDIAGYDVLMKQWAADTALNAEYQAYVDKAVQDLNTLPTPSTVAPTDADLIYSSPDHIHTLFQNTQMTNNNTCSILNLRAENIFSCQGQISGPAINSKDPVIGWHTMNKTTNDLLKSLVGNNLHMNLNWATCRFEEVQWSTSGASFIPVTKYTCEGPLGKFNDLHAV